MKKSRFDEVIVDAEAKNLCFFPQLPLGERDDLPRTIDIEGVQAVSRPLCDQSFRTPIYLAHLDLAISSRNKLFSIWSFMPDWHCTTSRSINCFLFFVQQKWTM